MFDWIGNGNQFIEEKITVAPEDFVSIVFFGVVWGRDHDSDGCFGILNGIRHKRCWSDGVKQINFKTSFQEYSSCKLCPTIGIVSGIVTDNSSSLYTDDCQVDPVLIHGIWQVFCNLRFTKIYFRFRFNNEFQVEFMQFLKKIVKFCQVLHKDNRRILLKRKQKLISIGKSQITENSSIPTVQYKIHLTNPVKV